MDDKKTKKIPLHIMSGWWDKMAYLQAFDFKDNTDQAAVNLFDKM